MLSDREDPARATDSPDCPQFRTTSVPRFGSSALADENFQALRILNHDSSSLAEQVRQIQEGMAGRSMARVGQLAGAFDPPHLGHLEAVRVAMQVAQLDFLVVSSHSAPSEWKPHLTEQSIRNAFLADTFRNEPKVFTSSLSRKQIAAALPQAKIFTVVGSDVLKRFLSEGIPNDYRADELIVIERDDAPLEEAPELVEGTPVRYVGSKQLAWQSLSSSQIREEISANQLDRVATKLDPSVVNAIDLNQHYRKRGIASSPTVSGPRQSIYKLDLPAEFEGCHIEEATGLVNGLLSGTKLLRVLDREGKPVAFTKTADGTEELEDEQCGLRFVRECGLNKCVAPESTFIANGKTLLIQRAPGQTYSELVIAFERGELERDELLKAFGVLGRSLRALHDIEYTTSESARRRYLDSFRARIDYVWNTAGAAYRGDSQTEERYERFVNAFERADLSNMRSSLVHGDANPGNFLWDRESEQVWMIDLGRLGRQLKLHEARFPAYEIHQFVGVLGRFPVTGFKGVRGHDRACIEALQAEYGPVEHHELQFFEDYTALRWMIGGAMRVLPTH